MIVRAPTLLARPEIRRARFQTSPLPRRTASTRQGRYGDAWCIPSARRAVSAADITPPTVHLQRVRTRERSAVVAVRTARRPFAVVVTLALLALAAVPDPAAASHSW